MLFVVIALALACLLRYLVPVRYGLTVRSGAVIRGIPLNVLAFWTVLVAAGITILVKVLAALARK